MLYILNIPLLKPWCHICTGPFAWWNPVVSFSESVHWQDQGWLEPSVMSTRPRLPDTQDWEMIGAGTDITCRLVYFLQHRQEVLVSGGQPHVYSWRGGSRVVHSTGKLNRMSQIQQPPCGSSAAANNSLFIEEIWFMKGAEDIWAFVQRFWCLSMRLVFLHPSTVGKDLEYVGMCPGSRTLAQLLAAFSI